jgi:hypothetical protein
VLAFLDLDFQQAHVRRIFPFREPG